MILVEIGGDKSYWRRSISEMGMFGEGMKQEVTTQTTTQKSDYKRSTVRKLLKSW